MYIHIRLTAHFETKIFVNNVPGRQWWSFDAQKPYSDRSSKFWVG